MVNTKTKIVLFLFPDETQFVTFVSYRNLRALMQPDDVEE